MEKRFMALYFPRLKTDWMTIRKHELGEIPFVFSISEQNRLVISATNALAEEHGLHMGMRLADAKAILPQLKILEDKPGREQKLLSAIAEWCIRYTPLVALDLPDGLLFNSSGCAHLWGGEQHYLNAVISNFQHKGYRVKVAISDTVGSAWAVARFGSGNTIVPPKGQKAVMAQLPPAALRLDAVHVDKLNKLGFRRIAAFAGIPQGSLRRRFGDGLLLRIMQAYGEVEEYINPIKVPEPYEERLPSMEPIRTRVGIEIALRKLLEMMGERLMGEGKGIRTATFKTYRVDGKTQQLQIGTNQATCHVEHLFKLFEQHINSIAPGLGIELFILEANRVKDADASQQTLWTGKTGLADNSVLELLDKLAGKIGVQAIHRYLPQERYWPERSIKLSKDTREMPQTLWRTDLQRPTQLLARPELIQVTAPIPDYPPMNFRHKNTLHVVKRADGPERIEREWWLEQGEHRDYYIVENQHGQRYWVYRSGHYGTEQSQWYLHGFFA